MAAEGTPGGEASDWFAGIEGSGLVEEHSSYRRDDLIPEGDIPAGGRMQLLYDFVRLNPNNDPWIADMQATLAEKGRLPLTIAAEVQPLVDSYFSALPDQPSYWL